LERHYSVSEVAELWGISPDLVRDVFQDEPDVVKINSPTNHRKRKYTTIRVPLSVMKRVHARNRNS